jgi:hypothetical protein
MRHSIKDSQFCLIILGVTYAECHVFIVILDVVMLYVVVPNIWLTILAMYNKRLVDMTRYGSLMPRILSQTSI